MAVDALGTGLYLPLSLLYFVQVTDLGLATLGVLISVTTALTLPVPLVVGRLVDRFGPRLVVACGQALQGLGFLFYLAVSGASSLVAAVLVSSEMLVPFLVAVVVCYTTAEMVYGPASNALAAAAAPAGSRGTYLAAFQYSSPVRTSSRRASSACSSAGTVCFPGSPWGFSPRWARY
ncbi:MFS transporter [Streptomyces aurantiacus]|uniref:MFS transporter n=1 Tax=Streptomyces aurantiacus TaxID=47760 RepID=UPI0027D872BD|nr:MFS transporter [Streptomyces aurantiacus]